MERGAAENAIETLSEHQCRELLALRDIGRIAFPLAGEIEIFPVNYATDGVIVVFRTAAGATLANASGSRVAFEVDEWDDAAGVGWSVVLKGVAEEVSGGSDPFSAALRSRQVVPLAPGARDLWIAIYPALVSGRRFRS
jgi:nitroimidazol reductase NimA-like FMN-containing flavoprotein (pyridoxamine 5'-phosphate oxidase superfamily)